MLEKRGIENRKECLMRVTGMVWSFLLAVLFLNAGAIAANQDYVWWEGEQAVKHNFADSGWFEPKNPKEREVLSNGDWLTNGGKRRNGEPEAFAVYSVNVPQSGTYHFWCRKFWAHGPFRWRFDQQEWQECGRKISLVNNMPLRKFVTASWVYLGQVKLSAGQHTFELKLTAKVGEAKTACFDAFVLSLHPFTPRGKMKPHEKSGKAESGYFAWEPDYDPLSDRCPIDLRYLNEKVAGEHGFLKRDGLNILRGDGKPVRFWMVQGSSLLPMSHNQIDWWARRLAKYGVNMVRIESSPWKKGGAADAIDQFRVKQLQYIVSALKKQGIYTYFGHFFWANWKIDSSKGFPPGYRNQPCHGLLEISDAMKKIYFQWLRALLLSPNPYAGGKPLAQEPALGVFEIQNEDSLLFWTFNPVRMPAPTRTLLERKFAQWLTRKYGSLAKAAAAWGPANPPSRYYRQAGRDDIANGVVKLYGIGHLTGQRWAVG
ncbi:MAG: hypothetical protein D6820_16385, partial [Lentisphaerae bacterium]